MTRRTSIVEQVGSYFASKGRALTLEEYKDAEDAPIRFQLIKRSVGSWSRLLNMVGDFNRFKEETPITPEKPKPVEEKSDTSTKAKS